MVPAPPLFTKEAVCLLPRMCSRPSASSGFPGMLFWHVEQYQTMSTSAAKTRPHGVRRGGGISYRYTVPYCVGRGFPVTGRGSVTGRGRSAAELDRTAVPHCGRKLSSLARRATRALLLWLRAPPRGHVDPAEIAHQQAISRMMGRYGACAPVPILYSVRHRTNVLMFAFDRIVHMSPMIRITR